MNSLSLYLKNRMNAVQTANEMFIHRLTLIYRLNKIKEITGLRWERGVAKNCWSSKGVQKAKERERH